MKKHYLLVGTTGAGKSSLINSLAGRGMAKVGLGVEPQTQKLIGYQIGQIVLWDSPGLGESPKVDQGHIDAIKRVINNPKIPDFHSVIIVIEGCKRDLGSVYSVFREIVKPYFSKRFQVVVNQVDQAMKGTNWDYDNKKPNAVLEGFLLEQNEVLQNRIQQNTGIVSFKPLSVSALYCYNIDNLHRKLIAML